MHTKAYTIFTALLLGGCAFTASVPETPLAMSVPETPLTTSVPPRTAKAVKPKVDAVTTATPEVKKKTQDPRKVTAQQVRARLVAMPGHPRLFIINGTQLQYCCLENPMDGGALWAAVHGVAKSRTQLSDFTFMHWRRKWQPTPV